MSPTPLSLALFLALALSGSSYEPSTTTRPANPSALPGGGLDVAALLPANTLAHLMFTGRPAIKHGENLSLVRLLREPEVQRFVGPLEELLDLEMQEASDFLETTMGMDVSEILEVAVEGRVTVSLLGMDPASGDPEMMVTVDFGSAADQGRTLVRSLEGLANAAGMKLDRLEVAGVRCVRMPIPSGPTVTWALSDGLLVATTTQPAIEDVLGRLRNGGTADGSLASNPAFRETRDRVVRPDSLFFAYAAVERLLEAFGPVLPPMALEIIQSANLDAIETVGYGLDLDPPGIRDRAFLRIPEPRGLWNAFSVPAAPHELARFVPADTVLFCATAIDAAQLHAWFMELMKTANPQVYSGLKAMQAGFTERSGVDIPALLASLGRNSALYVAMPGRALIPDIGVVFRVANPTVVQNALERSLAHALPGGVPVRKLDFRGRTIHYADIGSIDVPGLHSRPLKPSWCFLDGHLVINLWPQSTKNLIAGLDRKDPRLADKPDYAQSLQRLRGDDPALGSLAAGYLDLTRLVGFLCDNGVPFLQSLVPEVAHLPGRMDWAAFPTTHVITRHCFGLVHASRWTGTGMLWESHSLTGVLPCLGVIAGASAFLWTKVEQLEAAALQRDEALMDVSNLQTAVRMFRLREARLPNESEWPSFLSQGSKNHPNPYMKTQGGQLLDPWGHPYVYKMLSARQFDIISYGADGKPGGEGPDADISTLR